MSTWHDDDKNFSFVLPNSIFPIFKNLFTPLPPEWSTRHSSHWQCHPLDKQSQIPIVHGVKCKVCVWAQHLGPARYNFCPVLQPSPISYLNLCLDNMKLLAVSLKTSQQFRDFLDLAMLFLLHGMFFSPIVALIHYSSLKGSPEVALFSGFFPTPTSMLSSYNILTSIVTLNTVTCAFTSRFSNNCELFKGWPCLM